MATLILLAMCLVPQQDLPSAQMGDKIEHTIAWFILTGSGLMLSHQRPLAIGAYALGLGVLLSLIHISEPTRPY